MSRVGKLPIELPKGVEVTINGGQVTVKGSLGTLQAKVHETVTVVMEEGKLVLKPINQSKVARSQWGTARTVLNNLVQGVSKGYTRNLELNGVGYKAAVDSNNIITLSLGYSHDVKYALPEGIKVTMEKPTAIAISGASKELVGQVASEIRSFRKPEPYKGKGVKYAEERIRMKEGKKK
jgi:large subunit ribosomal protein L6